MIIVEGCGEINDNRNSYFFYFHTRTTTTVLLARTRGEELKINDRFLYSAIHYSPAALVDLIIQYYQVSRNVTGDRN